MHTHAITPITRADLAWWHKKLVALDWVFAVTYADGAPHEYITSRTEGMTTADFVRAARVIHTFGEPQKFYRSTRIYLVHDGWKYWTMGHDHGDVTLINRGRAHHVYGVQNAPRTASDIPSPYDSIATYWDGTYSSTDEECSGFTSLVDEVTGGYRKSRTLDIGAGTGLALDLGLTDSFRMTVVDPSRAMLNELVRKHPLVARVEPATFRTVREQHRLGGTKFDLVLALGGSGSYLEPEDWEALPDHAKGRYVLSVYGDGQEPPTGDLDEGRLHRARESARNFAVSHDGKVDRVGRFDVVVVSKSHTV